MEESMNESGAGLEPELAEFGELEGAAEGRRPENLTLLYDLTLPVSIELGRTRMTVQEVLGLSRGSVIQLDRLVGEAIDIYVGERRFAQGEVVVLGEQFGVRITRILAQPAVERAGE
jgi:flagellar motor switch protein FliN/FliY